MNNYLNNFTNFASKLAIEFGGSPYEFNIPMTEKHVAFLKFLESEVSRPFINDLKINDFISEQMKRLFSNEINCAEFSSSLISFLSSHVEKSLKTLLEENNSDEFWKKLNY